MGACLARIVPRSFLKREPILLDCCPDAGVGVAVGEMSGIASTLVEADTSVGAEILFGLIRFRVTVPPPSFIFGIDGDLRSAAVAASARRCTSNANCAELMPAVGERGESRPPGLVGIVFAGGDVGAVGDVAWRSESERFGVCSGLMGASTAWRGSSSSSGDDNEPMSGMMEICGARDAAVCSSSAPNSASASALFRRMGLDCSISEEVGTARDDSSTGRDDGGGLLGDSMLSTTALRSAFAFAICSLVASRGDTATAAGDCDLGG